MQKMATSFRFRIFSGFGYFVVSLLVNATFGAISPETEAAMRDFSKLRLESPPPNKPFLDPYKYKPEEASSSASEDVDVVFKPSYPDVPGPENPNEDEFSHNPSQMEGPKENDGDYENESGGRYFSHQNSNSPNRPLIGGPGLDDESGIGMVISPTGYGEFNPNSHQHERGSNVKQGKPEISHSPDEGAEYFHAGPPRPGFPNQAQGNDETYEKGAGGLFDGEESNSDDEGPEDGSEGYFGPPHGHRRPPHPHHSQSDDSDDEGVQGYGGGRGPHQHHHPGQQYNNDDYGDY